MPRLWLLVDDDPTMAVLVRLLFRPSGDRVASALDADAASRAVAAERPDFVLLDVNLPGTSGVEWLRQQKDRPPVILFAQRGMADDIAAGWDAGADYLLDKALVADPAGWRARVEEIITHSDGRAARPSLQSSPRETLAEWWNPALERTLGRVPVVQRAALLRRALWAGVGEAFDPRWVDAGRGLLDRATPAPDSPRRCGEAVVDGLARMFGGNVAHAFLIAVDRSGPGVR